MGQVVGDVKGKIALLVDDMIDTAGTITEGAVTLLREGAAEVLACATHPVLSGPAIDRLQKSAIKEVVVTNTIPLDDNKRIDKLKILSIAPIFAQTILNVFEDKSVSEIFEDDNLL